MRFSAKWLEDAELNLRSACFPQEPQTPSSLPMKSRFGAPVALEVGKVGKRGQGQAAQQQAQRDLDFFINRHEHDPLQKFVLSKKQLLNVKKGPKQRRELGTGHPSPGPHP